jgi:KaiC/GvpD/RAD55 family RecA-like ATPase
MTHDFEHPEEVPEPAEELIDLMALAGEEPEKFDPTQQVVQIQSYKDFVEKAVEDGKRSPKKVVDEIVAADDAVAGAKFLARIEFDEDAAIERVKNKKWLIYGFLPHNDVGYIYGRPGSYKSFMALDVASRVASASKWNGIDVDYPGMVLYIAAEGGSELHLRKKAWRIETGEDNSAVTILEASVIINSAVDREQLKAAMREVQKKLGMKYVLVVIDTFSKCFVGNENDAADMRAFISGCEDIRDSFDGCTVLFVGHTGKGDSASMRGSSVAFGDCGFSYKITRGKEKLYAELHTDKIKDAIEPEDMAFEFTVVKTGDVSAKGLDLASLVPKMTAMLDRTEMNADFDTGRAEKEKVVPRANQRVKSIIMSQLRLRSAKNNGAPEPRMVVRDDVMTILTGADEMNQNTAKTNWQRAFAELVEEGSIKQVEGDLLLPVKGR